MNEQTDNQQRKISEIDVAWLAGLWDGEGSIGLRMQGKHKYGRNEPYIAPYAQIVNTNLPSLKVVDEILTFYKIGHHISWQKLHKAPNGITPVSNYKPLWKIAINGLKRTKTFLNVIQPYLVLKDVDAVTVMNFINSRETHQYKHLPYTDYEISLANNYRMGRRKGKPSEVTFTKSLNDYMQDTLAKSVKV